MRVLRLVGAAVVVAGCGGGGDGGGGPSPQVPVTRVDLTPNIAQSTTLCGNVGLSATPRDAQGNALSRNVAWTASNAAVLTLSSNSGASVSATGIGIGSSTVTATSEGVPSTPVTVTVTAGQAPSAAEVSATAPASFSPTCVVVATGGTVTWTFGATQHNVNFTQNSPPGGDIGVLTNTTAQRTFQTAGDYPYVCDIHPGMTGRVIVQ